MPVAMMMRWEGVGLDTYETVRAQVEWETHVPRGALFHACAHDGTALRVFDLWESPEDFQAFVDQRLMPVVLAQGVTTTPQVEIYPTHAIFAPAYSLRLPSQPRVVT